MATNGYTIEEFGTRNTLDYRCFFKDAEGKLVSPFHDIPVWADEKEHVVNMIVEVPRWSNAKMEISKDAKLNPILQDSKKGKARFVHNCFPHHGYIWNYGAIPQTWENPEAVDSHTGQKGDNDPLDICEIGSSIGFTGEVKQVKILGVMALIDEGETDWKLIGIDINDPKASKVNDVDDIDKVFPGLVVATNEWFRIYKIPAGKPENEFAFKGECMNKEFALGVINETNEQWKAMITGDGYKDLSCMNTASIDGAREKVSADDAAKELAECPAKTDDAPLDPSVHDWHYITL